MTHSNRLCRDISIVVGLALVLAVVLPFRQATAENFSAMSERELDKELALVINKERQLQDLTRLQSIGNRIAKHGTCGQAYDRAIQSHRDLLTLNEQYGKRADRKYRQQEEQLRQDNAEAVRDYRQCFSDLMGKLSLQWPEKGIIDYQSFQRLFASLAIQLGGESEAALKKKAEQLYAAKQRIGQASKFPLGSLLRTKGDGQLIRQERRIPLENGMNVLAGDQLSTSSNGRIEIEFTEVVGGSRRGPFSLSIGPSSRITIGWQSNMVVEDRQNEAIGLDLTLQYGTVRVVSIGAGFDSNYIVHSAQTNTQILGADTVISHYPKRKLVNSKLLLGVVEISQGSGKPVRLEPNQQLSVHDGVMQSVSELPASQWAAALMAAGTVDPAQADNKRHVTEPVELLVRQDIQRRDWARAAVDSMLSALRAGNANGLLTSTSGQARRNARNSMRKQSLHDFLKDSGRPIRWFHDCVACTPDGYCSVPTEVKLKGGAVGQYEALHVVKPAGDDGNYTVDRIDPWNDRAQKIFRSNKPLCEAGLPGK